MAKKSINSISYDDIIAAQGIVSEAGLTTPGHYSAEISALCGAGLYLKLENLQPTGSFKVRGALIKLANLDGSDRSQGVVAMSAGNHAQGVAYHAQKLGIKATIVMPTGTPFTKVNRTQRLGAKVILAGKTLTESQEQADRISKSEGLVFIHPYDDPDIITGQG
ncbi:MAG: pyridoxal-phosphate dependent enzyme, partial [Rhodospirillaceae bacterium]|nr:pyridoxal-phosphate dependent enzyme [Rhodospirillaceae bacterium]